MRHFPEFARSLRNKVAGAPEGMDGFVFDGVDGAQVVLWENTEGGEVPLHTHDYWEYCYILDGIYEGMVDGKTIVLKPGDECAIPPGVPHQGKHSSNYRAIDIFGGKRASRIP